MKSRSILSKENGFGDSKIRVDIAEEKLAIIISKPSTIKAYGDYIKDIKQELNKEVNDEAVYG